MLQFHSLTETAVHQKLHYVRDTRVRFIISESSDPGDQRLAEADVILLCFSLDSSVSLANIVSQWSEVCSKLPTLLLGTMSDIRESQASSYQQSMSVAKQIGALTFMETSSKLSFTSTTSAFEAAAVSVLPHLMSRQSSSLCSNASLASRHSRDKSLSRSQTGSLSSKTSTLEGRSSTLSSIKKTFSLSNGSLHSKSSTLSSSKSNTSVLSVSTGKTPVMSRRRNMVQEQEERMVTIKVERLTRDKQVEEVEIEIPLSVYNNIQTNEDETGFVRNSGKRKSLACKLKNLILR